MSSSFLFACMVCQSLIHEGLKHHTSKIAAFSDLSTVNTFGFRGEALSSLCAMCDEVTVTTRATEAVGVVLELDNTGKVKGKKRVARQVSEPYATFLIPYQRLARHHRISHQPLRSTARSSERLRTKCQKRVR